MVFTDERIQEALSNLFKYLDQEAFSKGDADKLIISALRKKGINPIREDGDYYPTISFEYHGWIIYVTSESLWAEAYDGRRVDFDMWEAGL